MKKPSVNSFVTPSAFNFPATLPKHKTFRKNSIPTKFRQIELEFHDFIISVYYYTVAKKKQKLSLERESNVLSMGIAG